MFDIAGSLMTALGGARAGMTTSAAAVSRSQTRLGSERADTALASAARGAIFAEALLGALHARLAEIKTVTHG